nr:DUF4153 domain-containing protein [uncultured Dyadobacter sp.]
MREEILLNLDNPGQLEKLYRANKPTFKSAFNTIYPQLRDNPLAEGWHQRLNYGDGSTLWGTPDERILVITAALLSALIAKLPEILSLDNERFYTRNVGFIVFPMLMAYFAWKNKVSRKTCAWITGVILLGAVFINSLPHGKPDDVLNLSCIHLPLLLWSLLGLVFGGGKLGSGNNWLGFLRYNGELVVMTALILMAGAATTGITVGLFELIGFDIKEYYFKYVVICGLAALPIVATFLTQAQPTLVNKVSPVIANLFSPVALLMLTVYLISTAFSQKSPYHDREFLLLFNVLLVGVMALIFFSVTETHSADKNRFQITVLFLLSVVTLVANGIALSAVLFRISEWGITPNRAAVMGANILMLIHLLYMAIRLFGTVSRKTDLSLVGKSMAIFLPVYGLWSAIVTFLFPLIFGFD